MLIFWLRDCPHCKRELPKVQRLYDRWGRSGLQVLSVAHKHTPAELAPAMRQRGWDFPVATDPIGRMATLYGGGRRPGYYVIGLDGRVKTSNALSDTVIREELARYRVAELGRLPSGMEKVREAVWQGNYGEAVRVAEAAAAAPAASDEVKKAAAHVVELARAKMENRAWRAGRAWKRGARQAALGEYRGMVASFEGTSLEARARSMQAEFLRESGVK